MSVITSERHMATGASRTCPKCQGKRLMVRFEAVTTREARQPTWHRVDHRDRFQCLDCWHVWYEEVQ